MMNRYRLILLMVIGLAACQPKQENAQEQAADESTVDWPTSTVAYEIFVQSFADADGDSIGDFKGMTSKLDYLNDLGAGAIWLMPIMESPSYHKYDVTDYRSVHPDYGTMDEFKTFVEEAHARDIKVIVDFIINHTSSEHPWFLDAKTGPDAEYREYYVWANKDSIAEEIAKKETSFDSDNITQWHAVDGDTTAEHYYGFFYGGMPDLNFDNPAVRKEIYDIGRYWLEDVGVDGFRMDAAKHIYPDDRAADNHAFWTEFKQEMQKVKPDVYIVGEVWANTAIQAPFINGFTSLFNFDLAFSILETVQSGSARSAQISGHGWKVDSSKTFIDGIIANDKVYKGVNPEYIDAIFLSNHDQNRVMSVLDNNTNKAKLAASIMFTLPGTPYIYYGEEIGMKGMKPDPNIREPFLWSSENDSLRAAWINPAFTTDLTVKSLSDQQEDERSIYNHYKDWIEVRMTHEALTLGDLKPIENTRNGILMFTRSTSDQELLIIHNLSDLTQGIEIPAFEKIVVGDDRWFKEQMVSIPKYKSVILQR